MELTSYYMHMVLYRLSINTVVAAATSATARTTTTSSTVGVGVPVCVCDSGIAQRVGASTGFVDVHGFFVTVDVIVLWC